MTANELNAESARALAADTRKSIDFVTDKCIRTTPMPEWAVMRLLDVASCQQDLLAHAFARIEALEAAARERGTDANE